MELTDYPLFTGGLLIIFYLLGLYTGSLLWNRTLKSQLNKPRRPLTTIGVPSDEISYGGWYLCSVCGKRVKNGNICNCPPVKGHYNLKEGHVEFDDGFKRGEDR